MIAPPATAVRGSNVGGMVEDVQNRFAAFYLEAADSGRKMPPSFTLFATNLEPLQPFRYTPRTAKNTAGE